MSLSRPQLDAPPLAPASAEEVLGATSPPTADCENYSDRVTTLQEVSRNHQITYKSNGFSKFRALAREVG